MCVTMRTVYMCVTMRTYHEDERVENDGVEEGERPGCLVAQDKLPLKHSPSTGIIILWQLS